jgi:transposase
MTTSCGVDFHARQQTRGYCDTADGLIQCRELHHDKDDVCVFYAQFTGDVIVGLEASGYSTWFIELLETLGHQVLMGDATEIRRRARRRQKTDRRDAELMLDLLLKGAVLQKLFSNAKGHGRLFLRRRSGRAMRQTSPALVHHYHLIF